MNFCLRILSLLLLITATLTQDGFDLSDALEPDPTPEKPKEQPESPKKSGSDAPTPAPKKPSSGDSGGFGFDLEDAIKPGAGPTEKPKKPGYNPSGGGGGSFDDSDLMGVSNDGYKPDDGGRSGGRAMDPGNHDQGGAGQSQDPDLLWGQVLKMLNANMPEEFFMWISNLKKVLNPLLERVMELLQNLP
ncbi:CD99 molecule isoform X2 [Gambusia affinis]|uniref:CD99 molecule isoform X2 n=1 Tax=Gambusia affinis TaxID=33528 RepID=UPI001CDD5C53|nr:CD99 molecule isoform X2 [Gambusia affinis]